MFLQCVSLTRTKWYLTAIFGVASASKIEQPKDDYKSLKSFAYHFAPPE